MANQRETVVGVFTDESYARRAIEELQSAGFNVRVADESALDRLSDVAQQEASVYLNRYQEGNTIVLVDGAGNRGEDALNIMLEHGAEYMNLHGAEAGRQMQGQAYGADYYQNLAANERQYGRYDTSTGRARTADEMRVQLREEELVPTKQAVEAGEVEVRKTVHEEQREVPVDLKREEVYIDRREVDQPITGEVGELTDETIRVPVYEEQAHLEKQGRVAEEVVIGKNVEQERETLTGTVRREDVEIEGDDVNTRGWNDVQSNYRTRWEQRHGGSGERWEDYEPAYRYAHEMRSNPQYRDRSWNEVEPELRRDWESRGERTPWEKAADTIRDAWNDATSDREVRAYDTAER